MSFSSENIKSVQLIKKVASAIACTGLCVVLSFGVAVPTTLAGTAYADDASKKQAEAQALYKKIDELQTKLNAAMDEYFKSTDAYIAATDKANEAAARVKATRLKISGLQDNLGKRAKAMYKSGGGATMLDVALGATTFESFVTAWDAAQAIAENDAKLIEEAEAMHAEAEAAESEYRQQQATAKSKMEQARTAQADMRTMKANMEADLAKMNEEIVALQHREEEERMAAQAAALRAAQAAAVIIPSEVASGWVHPCPDYQYISTEFGYSSWHGYWHNGTDLAAPSGAPILAASKGTVIYVGWYGGGGNTVIVSHGNGVRSIYMHMSQQAAVVGQEVNAGDVIGFVGSTGNSTGPHLHFQVEIEGVPVNGRNFVNF